MRDSPAWRAMLAARATFDPSTQPISGDAKHTDAVIPVIDPDTFIPTARLASDAITLASLLDPATDLIIAIPRSGLLPASIVATALHLPLAIVRDGTVVLAGQGARLGSPEDLRVSRPVVIDDTAAMGRAMGAAFPIVREAFPGASVTRAVVYCHPQARHAVDLAVYELGGSHYLEWNWVNAGHGLGCAFDFDGILCEECPAEDNDAGPRYARFLKEARPLYLPRRSQVPLVVTARHERYRPETVAWLDRHGISVARLVMRDWDCPDEEWVQRVASWKGEHYVQSSLPLFAESEPAQAELIARTAGKPVLCPAAGRVFRPPARPSRPTPRGPGTVLHSWLNHFPWLASEGCGCQSDAAEMDRAGPEGVLANLDMWVDRLKVKPQARLVHRVLIKTVIKRACAAAKSC